MKMIEKSVQCELGVECMRQLNKSMDVTGKMCRKRFGYVVPMPTGSTCKDGILSKVKALNESNDSAFYKYQYFNANLAIFAGHEEAT